jgi:hypothetical protein
MYREVERTSQKRRICDACMKKIEAGDRYLSCVGVQDGQFWSASYHPDCRAWEVKLNYRNGYDADEWMCLSDHVGDEGLGVLDGAPDPVRARFIPIAACAGDDAAA